MATNGIQTTAVAYQATAFAGLLAGNNPRTMGSYVSAEASAEIPFGRMIVQGTGDRDGKLMAAQADKMIGVVVHSQRYAKDVELGDTGLKPKTTLDVLSQGEIWVAVTEAVTPASVVRVHKTGGTFLTTASAGNTVALTNCARYLDTTTGAGFARVQFDLTGRATITSD